MFQIAGCMQNPLNNDMYIILLNNIEHNIFRYVPPQIWWDVV